MNRMALRNKKIAESKIYRDESWPPQDNKEMCFAQGKPAVNAEDPDCKVIKTRWPNGVVDRWTTATNEVIRTWPDGKEESFIFESKEHTKPVIANQR